MGWGYYEAKIIYGFRDDRDDMINHDCLPKKVYVCTDNINKDHSITRLYGVMCEFNHETGSISISDTDKKIISDFMDMYMRKWNVEVKLEYYPIMYGDCGWDIEMYCLCGNCKD